MKKIYLAVLFTVCICDVLLVTGIDGPQCFQYTWLGAGIVNENCTEYQEKFPYIPCTLFHSIHTGVDKPNTTELWDQIYNKKNKSQEIYLCPLQKGNACVRYTYIYNGAVMNVSYFCGKVIEDKTTAIDSNCFVQYTEGYTIEACACQSRNGIIPCNSTGRNIYSILITFMATAVSLFIYKMFNIP